MSNWYKIAFITMMLFTLFALLTSTIYVGAFAPTKFANRWDTSIAGYVPEGMTPEQYRKLKEKEKAATKGKNLGAFGVQTFKSRSLVAFQKDLEQGKAGHLMPVFNAKELLKQKKIKPEDIPYMQRGGSWDGTDVGKKYKGNEMDKKYNQNQKPDGLDWMGRNVPTGPKKATPVKSKEPPKKKFGLW